MNCHEVKALTFDTGGTILDWHTGFVTALAEMCSRRSYCVHSRRHCRIIRMLGTTTDTIFEGIAYAQKDGKRKN